MAVKFTLEVDTTPLQRMVVNGKLLDGEAVLYGVQNPAPLHTGGAKGKPSGVTTAFLLARIEFGPPRTAPRPKVRRRRRASLARSILRKILRGFGLGRRSRPMPSRARPVVPTSPLGERPVIRWVAATKQDVMRAGFRAAAKRALGGKPPRGELEVLSERLAKSARDRLQEVGAVVTGQTRDSITGRVVRRFGPDGGGPG